MNSPLFFNIWFSALMSRAPFPTSDCEFTQEHSCLADIIYLLVVRHAELLSFILRASGTSASASGTLRTRPPSGVMNDGGGGTFAIPSSHKHSEESTKGLQNLTLQDSGQRWPCYQGHRSGGKIPHADSTPTTHQSRSFSGAGILEAI